MERKIDKAEIEKQAKEILDKFASALEKVDKEKVEKEEYNVTRDEFLRFEGEGKLYDSGFKKRFLGNSPEHDEDFIIAEKGDWK